MASINVDLVGAKEELLRVQTRIVTLTAIREVKTMEGAALELQIATVSSTMDHLCEEFAMHGDQV